MILVFVACVHIMKKFLFIYSFTVTKTTLAFNFYLNKNEKKVFQLILGYKTSVLGICKKDVNYDLINPLVMCTRKYIFQCIIN